MTLGDLIGVLDRLGGAEVPRGFANPHSWRGHYDEIAFEPVPGVHRAAELAEIARGAVGETFEGWRGGHYTMVLGTEAHLAHEGNTCGPDLGLWLFAPPLVDLLDELGEA